LTPAIAPADAVFVKLLRTIAATSKKGPARGTMDRRAR
jgi:hypothetical protein